MMTRYLKFWGTRGSCPVSGPEYIHFGGNTASLELRYDDQLVIFDSGTGIRPLGLTLKNEKIIHLFLGHHHWDHMNGFPFFKPIHVEGTEVHIWAPQAQGRTTRELFAQLLAKEFFPVDLEEIKAKIEFHLIEEKKPIEMGALRIDFHQTNHPGNTLCFKITTPKEQIGYVTDNEIDPENQKDFIAFHKGVDLLIHEAQYTENEYKKRIGWGHSPLGRAIELIRKIEPGKWLVTHHDPKHTDEDLRELERLATLSDLPCPVEWIGDGYTIRLKS